MKNYLSTKLKLKNKKLELLVDEKNFKGTNAYHKIKCICGYKWDAKLAYVLDERKKNRESRGCPICASMILFEKSFDYAKKIIAERNDEIIGVYHKYLPHRKSANWFLTYILKCENNHEYESESSNLKSTFCAKCNEKTFVGQERVRLIIESNFNKKFKTIRPDWLKNTETNKNLELDGFNEELKIAFEFQGRQHLKNDTTYSSDFQKQQKRDLLKKDLCEKNSVKLLIINQPASYNEEYFFNDVIKQLKKQNININIVFSDIDFGIIGDQKTLVDKYNNFKNILENSDYTLISKSLTSMKDILSIKCKNNHMLNLSGEKIKNMISNSIKCPECINDENKIIENKFKITLITKNKAQEIAKNYGYELLSINYENVHQKLSWKCGQGHVFEKSCRQIVRSSSGIHCDECGPNQLNIDIKKTINEINKNKKIGKTKNGELRDYGWLKNFANKNNCEPLDSAYLGLQVKHKFCCNKNHIFENTISDLLKKESKGSVFCTNNDCSLVTKIDVDFCNTWGKQFGLECLSKNYENVWQNLSWKCSNNHFFERNFRSLQRSKSSKKCPKC